MIRQSSGTTLREKIKNCRQLNIQNMEHTLQHKMVYLFLSNRKLNQQIKSFNLNPTQGLIRIQFLDSAKALQFYDTYNFNDKIIARHLNIYLSLELQDHQIKRYFVQGLKSSNLRALFEAVRKIGICKLNTNYQTSSAMSELKTSGVLCILREEQISQKEMEQLEDDLKKINVHISPYKQKKLINNNKSNNFKLYEKKTQEKLIQSSQVIRNKEKHQQEDNKDDKATKNTKKVNLRSQVDEDQKKEGQKEKYRVLVISEVHRNRIDNLQSVDIANYAIKRLNQLSEGRFQFYSDYLEEFPQTKSYCESFPKLDFILTVGTNHTLMYTFYRFEKQTTPPILGFSSEGQSTLFNFTKCDLDQVLEKFVQRVGKNQTKNHLDILPKLKFTFENLVKNITCEIQIGRGKNPALVKMELYYQNPIHNQQIYIGKLWGDGLVISTAYGSVSRSMVLNGPIIHKKIQSLILTPVCPLSLKFRPIVLPVDCELIIKIDQHSRADGTVYIDGVNTRIFVKPGQTITISKSEVKTTMVSNLNGSYEKTLFENLQDFLSWGEQFSSKDYKSQHNLEI